MNETPKPGQIPVKIKISGKKILLILTAVVVLILFSTGLYVINPEEVGVIQRFGKYLKTSQPGLNFKIPFGVDQLTKVEVRRVLKEEFGFRTIEAGVRSKFSNKEYNSESLMLTGDLNIADVEWIIQYRIKDPKKYLFNVRNVKETLRDVAESTARQIVGDRSVDEVIVLSRKDIAYEVETLIQEILNNYNTGIEIVKVNLQNVNPPQPVQKAFNDVNSAKQEEEKIVNQALQKYNQVIPEARGKAKRTIEEAEGYAVNRINRAEGDANRFNSVWKEYNKAKTVTKSRLYIESMEKVLNNADKVYIVDDEVKSFLPLLNLNQGGAK